MDSASGEIAGGTYIRAGTPKQEVELTNFPKAAIALKMKIRDEAEKPGPTASWKQVVSCDNKFLKEGKVAVEKPGEDWNQKPEEGIRCCPFCLKTESEVPPPHVIHTLKVRQNYDPLLR